MFLHQYKRVCKSPFIVTCPWSFETSVSQIACPWCPVVQSQHRGQLHAEAGSSLKKGLQGPPLWRAAGAGQGTAWSHRRRGGESTVLPDKFMCLFSPAVTQSLRVPVFFFIPDSPRWPKLGMGHPVSTQFIFME